MYLESGLISNLECISNQSVFAPLSPGIKAYFADPCVR